MEREVIRSIKAWRKQIAFSRAQLERWLKRASQKDEEAFPAELWGEKGSYLTAMQKLAALDIKLMELAVRLESKAKDSGATSDQHSLGAMTQEEWQLLEQAVSKQLSEME